MTILLPEGCEGFLKLEHKSCIYGEEDVEIIIERRKIIIQGKLWLNKEFTNSVFTAEIHSKR